MSNPPPVRTTPVYGATRTDASGRPGRNLVVCCDGTSNEFGDVNTNVVRLFQALIQDPLTQLAYYDPGVGTLPEPGLRTRIGQKLSLWGGLAFGWGLTRNVEEAYTFLMNSWLPGDRVFLVGFSRGAYTVRVLASALHQIGLLPPTQEHLLPYALRLFNAIRGRRSLARAGTADASQEEDADSRGLARSYWRLCGQFRNTFARPLGRTTRHFPVHFLGVWDTVSSYGWLWNPRPFPFTKSNPSVAIARHAIALDERRWFFQQNRFSRARLEASGAGAIRPEQDLVERWFPGVHGDIGGGYSQGDGGLWRVAFEWLLAEAQGAGVLVDHNALAKVRSRSPIPQEPWLEPKHESLRGQWWLGQFVPKLVYNSRNGKRRIRFGGLSGRRSTGGAVLHASVLRRIRADTKYRPPSLPQSLIRQILDLRTVDDSTTVTVPSEVSQ